MKVSEIKCPEGHKKFLVVLSMPEKNDAMTIGTLITTDECVIALAEEVPNLLLKEYVE